MSRTIWFDYLTDAYVQTGKYEVAEKYLPGQHFAQGIGNVVGATSEVDLPESFSREWATFADGDDTDLGYDPGAYGIGVGTSSRAITMPKVQHVHLLYMYDLESTRQVRTLVQVPYATDAETDLGDSGLKMINDDLSKKVFSEDSYIAAFAGEGFNRFGSVYPTGVIPSSVSELHSLTGTFVDTADQSATYRVYVSPLYINNDRPLFDFIYLQKGIASNLDGSGISGYLLRWQGGVTSENIAPINREGNKLVRDGYLFKTSDQTVSSPSDATTTVDGVAYTNADAYNVRNHRRH